jgi:CRISPR-associated exonuclease Cas4
MLAAVLLILALLAWLLARLAARRAGLPAGRVVYADTGGWTRPERPLRAPVIGLTGKPDYLVQERGRLIPVEIKSMAAPPAGPYPGHVLQLAAYCALVTEVHGVRPPHGLLQYADRTLAVDYTPALEAELRALLDALRADAGAPEVHRSHGSPARCRACGFRPVCDESLA